MSVARLAAGEVAFIESLKGSVLEGMRGHKVPDPDRVLICMCGDGHHSVDAITAHKEKCECGKDVCHLLAVNGGPIRIGADIQSDHGLNVTEFMLGEIAQARQIKNINTIIMIAHAPCGVAMGAKMNVLDVLRALLRAKEIVREANPDAKVIGFFHLAYYDDKDHLRRRTYFMNGKELRAYLAKLDKEEL